MLSQSPAGGYERLLLVVTDKSDSVVTKRLTLSVGERKQCGGK